MVDPSPQQNPAINSSTGYGPSGAGACSSRRLYFNGGNDNYELWEVKFLGRMRLQKLIKVFEDDETDVDADDNANAFAELIQFIDDRSLSLVIREAKNNGRKSLGILREHYMSKSKNRVIALYTELTSMKLQDGQEITDYIIKAEAASTALTEMGENVSDTLLTAMVLKGLPNQFQTFCTIVTQRDKQMTFAEFKTSLRSYEENEKGRGVQLQSPNDSIMKIRGSEPQTRYSSDPPTRTACYSCGREGHRAATCWQTQERYGTGRGAPARRGGRPSRGSWRGGMQNRGGRPWQRQDERYAAQTLYDNSSYDGNEEKDDGEENNSFVFKIGYNSENVNIARHKMLVDCGATVHIVNDISHFVRFDKGFESEKHTIELADGSRQKGVVQGKGTAKFTLSDIGGNEQNIFLDNTLYVPTYKQNIFSVQAATSKGAWGKFQSSKCGTDFK